MTDTTQPSMEMYTLHTAPEKHTTHSRDTALETCTSRRSTKWVQLIPNGPHTHKLAVTRPVGDLERGSHTHIDHAVDLLDAVDHVSGNIFRGKHFIGVILSLSVPAAP